MQGSVTLNAVPAASVVVALSSSNPSVVSVPANVTVPAGSAASPKFNITTNRVQQQQVVTITATYLGNSTQATLTVAP